MPAFAWMAIIFWLSSRPDVPDAGFDPSVVSVAAHLVAFGLLAVLIAMGLLQTSLSLPWVLCIAWTVATIYGVSDEIHQSFVPNRHATIWDVLTDAFGAAVFLALLLYVLNRSNEPA